MKKLLAILTVMTMVLTTLVVPTVAFGNTQSVTVSVQTLDLGDLYIVKEDGKETQVPVDNNYFAHFSYDGNTWYYGDDVVTEIFLKLYDLDGQLADWTVMVPNEVGPPTVWDTIGSDVGIVGYGNYPTKNFTIEAQFVGDDDDDFESNYTIPDNQIIVSYYFYTASGKHNFHARSINIGSINENGELVLKDEYTNENITIQDLVDEYGAALDDMHYQDTAFDEYSWVITGTDVGAEYGPELAELPLSECAVGGFRVNAYAQYENDAAPVQVTLCYYDENGDYCEDEMVYVVREDASEKKTTYVYDELDKDGKLNVSHNEAYIFDTWSCPELDLFSGMYEDVSFYIEPLEIKATYINQPVQVTCTYKDNGEAVTITGKTIVGPNQNLYDGFEAFLLAENIPVEDVIGWAFNSNDYNNWQHEGQPQDKITVAAVYEDSTPVYVDRASVKFDSIDHMYYVGQDRGEIIYINSEYPENINYEDGDDYSSAILSAANAKFGKNPGEMTFKEFRYVNLEYSDSIVYKATKEHPEDPEPYLYCCAPMCDLTAEYEEVFVEIIGEDGTATQELWDPEEEYVVPGSDSDIYNIEGPGIGGDTIPGGESITLFAPYTILAMWTLSWNELADVQIEDELITVNEIQQDMQDETIEGKPSWDASKVQIGYHDIELLKSTENGGIPATSEEFPDDGVWVTFEYPEGTDRYTVFVITHMITDGDNAGEIETIIDDNTGNSRLIRTERGIKVKMYSLSPIALAYTDEVDEGSAIQGAPTDSNQPGTINPNSPQNGQNQSAPTPDKAVNTGDDFSAIPFIAIMAIALAGVAAAMFRRKTVK